MLSESGRPVDAPVPESSLPGGASLGDTPQGGIAVGPGPGKYAELKSARDNLSETDKVSDSEDIGKLAGAGEISQPIRRIMDRLEKADKACAHYVRIDDIEAAKNFADIANRAALDALDEAIKLCDAATAENQTATASVPDVERLLGFPEGTFNSCFVARGTESDRYTTIDPRTLLMIARGAVALNLARTTVDPAPPATPRLAHSVIRICSAVIIGAVFGAPLAALTVHESLLKEMVKAFIEIGIAAIGAEAVDFTIKRHIDDVDPSPPSIRAGGPVDQEIDHVDPTPPSIRAGGPGDEAGSAKRGKPGRHI